MLKSQSAAWRRPAVASALGLLFALAPSTRAAHVAPLSAAELADHAAQVIVGDVIAQRSYWAQDPRRIETELTFANVRYLKGRLPDSAETFTLVLPGGQVGETQMRLCCAPEFAPGQRWCLFLLAESSFYPIVGFNQGALRIVADAEGVERVHTADGRAVTGLDELGFVQAAPGPSPEAPVVRAAHGVRILPRDPQPPVAAKSFAALLEELEPVLATSRPIALQAPAGRYIPTQFAATTLKPAGEGAHPPEAAGPPAAPRGADAVQPGDDAHWTGGRR